MTESLKRTPLYEEHARRGAKLIPFAGYEMPVHYAAGIVAEHKAVREHAGLFDVSHMGEIFVTGEDPVGLLQLTTTNDVSKLSPGQAQYSAILQEDGAPIDDCIVYCLREDEYMVVVNASNRDKDREWLEKYAERFDVTLVDRSEEFALLALQGPASQQILSGLTDTDLDSIAYYSCTRGKVAGKNAIISRTGYTGEDGFELYIDASDAAHVWQALFEADEKLEAVGLGARDSLRLEVGYALYGNDLDLNHTPLEAGLGWIVKLDKGDFIGKAALERQKAEGVRTKLVGFQLKERGFPRHGYPIRWNGEPVGEVTSGTVSPSLGEGVGMAWIAAEAAKPGTEIEIMIRDRGIAAEVVRPPFYKNGSIRK